MTDLSTLDADELAQVAGEHVARITDALNALDAIAKQVADLDTLSMLLLSLRDVKRSAGEVYDAYRDRVLDEAGEKVWDSPFGRFEIVKRTKRTGWRHDQLVPALVAHARFEESRLLSRDGEVEGEGEVVARVLRDTISFGAGKVRGLQARGFTPDEWCNAEEDGYDVRLPAVTQ